ncbi:MAG: hypothetical protein ABI723_02800 [Bacteroidia bacterium]
MNSPLLFQVPALMIAAMLFLLLILANGLGFRIRKMQLKKNQDQLPDWSDSLEGSLMGLMALILAFSFGIAASKFDARREMIVQEANDIGTALLRCDLYPDSTRNLLRADFQKYVEARISYYDAGDDSLRIKAALKEADRYSSGIWNRVVLIAGNPGNTVPSMQMIPALNSMIDIVTTRDAGRIAKVPPVILTVLLILTLISGFLAGYSDKKKKRNLITVIGFAAMLSITLYLVLELDRPRRGIINLDAAEQRIVDIRTMFN